MVPKLDEHVEVRVGAAGAAYPRAKDADSYDPELAQGRQFRVQHREQRLDTGCRIPTHSRIVTTVSVPRITDAIAGELAGHGPVTHAQRTRRVG